MFNFNDDVVYEKYKGKDKMNTIVYESPTVVKMKIADVIYKEDIIKNGNTVSEKRIIYHSPFEIDDKDRLDGRIILQVKECREPATSTILYWRVVVI